MYILFRAIQSFRASHLSASKHKNRVHYFGSKDTVYLLRPKCYKILSSFFLPFDQCIDDVEIIRNRV